MNDQKLMITNLDHIPGRDIEKLLGLVIGYSSVKSDKSGNWFVEGNGMKWPWADTPQHYEALFKESERRITEAAREMGAGGIVKAEGRLSRDAEGKPEVVLMGTAVLLGGPAEKIPVEKTASPDRPRRVVRGRGREEIPKPIVEEENEVAITIGGTSATWTPMTATPSDVRSESGRDGKRGEEAVDTPTLDLANALGISTSKAFDLISNGFDSLEKVSKAEIKGLTAIEGINPTQARLMIEKARSTISGK